MILETGEQCSDRTEIKKVTVFPLLCLIDLLPLIIPAPLGLGLLEENGSLLVK